MDPGLEIEEAVCIELVLDAVGAEVDDNGLSGLDCGRLDKLDCDRPGGLDEVVGSTKLIESRSVSMTCCMRSFDLLVRDVIES